MKKYKSIVFALAGLFSLAACENDDLAPGNPVISSTTQFGEAMFGDSLTFSADVADGDVPLYTLKAQLFYGAEKVSETVIRTKTDGDYSGKIFVPYYANVPNATATLKLVLQNINFTITEQEFDLALSRPDYPYLTFVTSDKEYRMERVGLYQYKATAEFPQKIKGYIKTPVVSAAGNEIVFGWASGAIAQGTTNAISFSNTTAGTYDIDFNTMTYEAAPFIKLMFAGSEMTMVDDNNYKIEKEFTKGQVIEVSGIANFNDWWIDSDFFQKGTDGKLTFLPVNGKYRITANFERNYFIVEHMNGNDLSALDKDGNAIWVIGWGIGKPTHDNNVNWSPDKGLCMAKIGDKKFQLTFKPYPVTFNGDGTIANKYDFKFFYQKNWGGEFLGADYVSTQTDMIYMTESGNFQAAADLILDPAKWYVITMDLTQGNKKAVMTLAEKK